MEIRELNHEKVLACLPDRNPWSHKGNFGKILLLCGSRGYTGAAYLSAMGALRAGAGLVFLGVPESIYAIEAVKLNEPVVFPLPDRDGMLSEDAIPEILERLPNMNAVLTGPGLGQSEGTLAVVKAVLNHARCPVVLDADGINVLRPHTDILRGRKDSTILTPHTGEFFRICSPSLDRKAEAAKVTGRIEECRMDLAAELARETNSVVLFKGHRTCISDGRIHYRNPNGNPGMAVGGSGDVLAGIITGLLGQALDPLEAAACGAWLHGAAGDICAREIGQYGMLPTDMLNVLPRLLK